MWYEVSQLYNPSYMCAFFLTLLASQQPLDALDEFVSVTVSVDADLFQLLVTHVCQHIQRDLPGDHKKVTSVLLMVVPAAKRPPGK